MMTMRLLMQAPPKTQDDVKRTAKYSGMETTDEADEIKVFERNVPFLVENKDRICLMAGLSAVRVPLPAYGIKGRIALGALARLWRNPESGFVCKCTCGSDAYLYSCSADPLAGMVRNSVYCPTCGKFSVITKRGQCKYDVV